MNTTHVREIVADLFVDENTSNSSFAIHFCYLLPFRDSLQNQTNHNSDGPGGGKPEMLPVTTGVSATVGFLST